jgi:hypothetical protein
MASKSAIKTVALIMADPVPYVFIQTFFDLLNQSEGRKNPP